MIDLLLDSSNTDLAVGISKNGVLIDSVSYQAWQRQSELMVDEIDKILNKHEITRKDISSVSVTKGPGSYTGVRIAMTIAKTVALALDCPLYVSSSLEAMRFEEEPTIAIVNARSKRSYVGVYQGKKAIVADCIMDNASLLQYIDAHPDFVISGDVGYLEIEGKRVNVMANLANAIDEDHLVKEPLGARPIYLKDAYESETKIIVRKMNTADIPSVCEIEKACFKNPYTEEQITYELMNNPVGYFFVAIADAKVIGFIDFMVTFDSATISQIAVDEAYRKKGVGTLLIGEMVKVCKSQKDEVDFITLEVRKSNENAHRFYKRHAFEDIVTKKAYYDDGEDAIYMVRSIVND